MASIYCDKLKVIGSCTSCGHTNTSQFSMGVIENDVSNMYDSRGQSPQKVKSILMLWFHFFLLLFHPCAAVIPCK